MTESKNPFKIAIIDDERDLVDTITSLLEARGFQIVKAYSGKSGLDLVHTENPDLVILDIMMPDLDGRDVLIKLKNDPSTKTIPVIMLTARKEDFERDYGMEIGADDYISKPYDGPSLIDSIKKMLKKQN